MEALNPFKRYQYRSDKYAYHVKVKDQTVTLKVRDAFHTVFFKQEFPLADFPQPQLSFSQTSFPNTLTLLAQKNLELSPYLPFALPSASKAPVEEPIPLYPKPVASPSSETLDPETLASLQTLSQKAKALAAAAELAEERSLRAVADNPQAIQQLIASQKQEEQALGELCLLRTQEKPYKYYQTVYQKLTGVCLASYTIKSGMVENTEKSLSAQLTPALEQGGEALAFLSKVAQHGGDIVPFAGPVLKIISGILALKNSRDNHKAVAYLTAYFADLDHSLRDIKALARLLAREKEKDICTLKPQGKFKGALYALKDWFTFDEADNPIVVFAVEDCHKFLTAILTQELAPLTPPPEVVAYILGRPLSAPQPLSPPPLVVTALPSSPSSSSSVSDPASRDEMRRMQEELQALKLQNAKIAQEAEAARREAQEARAQAHKAHAKASLANEALGLDALDDGRQLSLQSSDDPKSQKGVFVRTMMQEVITLRTQQEQQAMALLATQERMDTVEYRVDVVEEKQAKNNKKK